MKCSAWQKEIKWIGMLLACLMALLLCACACAEEVTIVASGYCGNEYVDGISGGNLTYQLDSNGKLTISGWGEMGYVPFVNYRSSINSVEITNGVSSIGYGAFAECSKLTSIIIPDSVKTIDDNAFQSCTRLTNLTIPDGVTEIGRAAFHRCSGLTSVTFSNNLTKIGDMAFSYCSSLKSITIPGTVSEIGEDTFRNCTSLTNAAFSEGLERIGSQAFLYCSKLATINLPSSLTKIDFYAFGECSSLTKIVIPDGVTEIGDQAFSGCSNATSVHIPDGVTKIGGYAFYGCESLTGIAIPSSVKEIGTYAFYDCQSLKHVVLPVDFAPTYKIGNSKSTIIYCYENSVTEVWAANKGYAITYLDGLDLTQPLALMLSAPQTALLSGESVTLVPSVFPEQSNPAIQWSSSAPGVIRVENGVLTVLADGTSTITASCGPVSASVEFWGSATLSSLETNAAGNLRTITKDTFSGSRFHTIVLPDSCISIASKAFASNTGLKAIYIPASVIVISNDAFEGCSDFVIIGESGSEAAAYATKKQIPFYSRLPE